MHQPTGGPEYTYSFLNIFKVLQEERWSCYISKQIISDVFNETNSFGFSKERQPKIPCIGQSNPRNKVISM